MDLQNVKDLSLKSSLPVFDIGLRSRNCAFFAYIAFSDNIEKKIMYETVGYRKLF